MKSRYLGYIYISLIASLSIVFVFPLFIGFNFDTIELGYYCAHRERYDYFIQTQQEWDALWQRTSSSEIPDIDFSSNIVIAVYMGERVTGGFRIEIINIVESITHRRVYIRETSPSPSDPVTLALTQPYHIVKLNRDYRLIVFIHTYEVHSIY
jgi:hypothetical protein